MPLFRFSRQLCICTFSRHFVRALCVCCPFPKFVVIIRLFSWTFCFPCHLLSRKRIQTLLMLELKQPYYDHLVIQSKKLLNFVTRRYVGWASGRKESASKTNQEADDRLFWPECCSKINRESEVQTEQFNNEDCQESLAEKYRSFEHNGVEIHDQERIEGFQAFVER